MARGLKPTALTALESTHAQPLTAVSGNPKSQIPNLTWNLHEITKSRTHDPARSDKRALTGHQRGKEVTALFVALIPGLMINIFQDLRAVVSGSNQGKKLGSPESVDRFLQ